MTSKISSLPIIVDKSITSTKYNHFIRYYRLEKLVDPK
jgi:hypothetical protein